MEKVSGVAKWNSVIHPTDKIIVILTKDNIKMQTCGVNNKLWMIVNNHIAVKLTKSIFCKATRFEDIVGLAREKFISHC